MLTWISLLLNVTVAALLALPFLAGLLRPGGRARSVKGRVALAAVAIVVVLVPLNLDYREEEPGLPAPGPIDAPGKVTTRAKLLAEAKKMLGMPMLDEDHPDGVLCCDAAFVPMNKVCRINERLVADYRALDDPTVRYPLLYDVRRCHIRKNLKFLFDLATGAPRNTPESPYFLRRINNLIAYLKSRGLYYAADAVKPKPGMLLFFQRPRDCAPTHVAVLSDDTGDEPLVIQTSGSFDGDGDGTPDLEVVEVPLSYVTARTNLVGFGDVPADP